MRIQLEHPNQPEVIALIDALDAYQLPLYPLESHHGTDIDDLSKSNVIFAVARAPCMTAIGCGAIVLGPRYGEIKRMYIHPDYRGHGTARALLAFLENEAQRRDCRELMLETGFLQVEALSLYEKGGYIQCPPFGDYQEDPNSVFMQKRMD